MAELSLFCWLKNKEEERKLVHSGPHNTTMYGYVPGTNIKMGITPEGELFSLSEGSNLPNPEENFLLEEEFSFELAYKPYGEAYFHFIRNP